VPVELRWVGEGDDAVVISAGHLFDSVPQPATVTRFLSTPGHHLCLALADGVPVGFVSGVETTHPDKGTEMFLYELAVDAAARGRGVGRTLVAALAERAVALGCYGMWVLTAEDNAGARRTYAAAGGVDHGPSLMFDWDLT
jgi:ribosomal protein S18 acetylase RimI-like enzyme